MSNQQPVVMVSGASRGLGAATARWLAAKGVGVTLLSRSEAEITQAARHLRDLGGRALPLAGDVSRWTFCRQAVEKTLQHFGRLNAIVNNAGVLAPLATIEKAAPDQWRYNLEVNLLGPFHLTKAALPALRKTGGRVINVSSGASHIALEAASAYCAAKAALNHFTKVLAAEEKALTTVAVRPGVVDTNMQTMLRTQGPAAMPKSQADYYRRLKDEGQLEPPTVPARCLAWLALNAPPEMSGEFISYDDKRVWQPALGLFGNAAGSSRP